MRHLALLSLLVACPVALGNPLVISHRIYIESEKLSVTVSDIEARVAGNFSLASVAGQSERERESNVIMQVPIWIPSKALSRDEISSRFWQTFKSDILNYLNEKNRPVLDRTIDLRVAIGTQSIEYRTFSIFTPDGPSSDRLPKEWRNPGLCCLVFSAEFSPALLKSRQPLRISYRQPLAPEEKCASFFYLPIFHNLPSGANTDDLAKYSLTLKASPRTLVTLPGKTQMSVAPGTSVDLPLVHHVPIRALAVSQDGKPDESNTAQPTSAPR